MIRSRLSEKQRMRLTKFRKHASSKNSEKALMVLLNDEGFSAEKIAWKLNRNPHTVRMWLKRYIRSGIPGLDRRYSPGRPSRKRDLGKQKLPAVIACSPGEFGYQDTAWSIPLLRHHLKIADGIEISEDTLTRCLKDLGYRYKRPAKTVREKAPGREEKEAGLEKMLAEIKALMEKHTCEIFALDESHFSTEPYLVRGWLKKRWPPPDFHARKTKKCHVLWMLASEDKTFLLETIRKS